MRADALLVTASSCTGVDLPATDYSHLNTALEAAAAAAQLVPTPVFMSKAQQLYEMILVRHGLMIVGYSYGAKTSIYRCVVGACHPMW